jgi:hypothetical protein
MVDVISNKTPHASIDGEVVLPAIFFSSSLSVLRTFTMVMTQLSVVIGDFSDAEER